MPKVGGVEFPYTKEGMRKAKAWSEMIGKPIQIDKKKAKKKYQQGGDTLRTHISVPRYSKNKKAGLDKLLLGSELHKKWIDQALEMPERKWEGYGHFIPREDYDIGLVDGTPHYVGKKSGKAVMWDALLQDAYDRGELDISTKESKEKLKKLLSGKSKYKHNRG